MSRFHATAGPLFIGFCLSMILYGTLVAQAFFFYQSSKKDKLWIRLTVLYLFAMETAITGYDMHQKYTDDAITFALASGERTRASVGSMTSLTRMLAVNAILTVLVSTPVQLFLAWRIKVVGGPRIVLGIITFAAIGSFAGGVATAIYVPRGDEAEAIISLGWSPSLAASFAPETIWLGMSAIADLGITGTLVYTLRSKRTGFQGTDDVVTKIIRFSVETGLITTICTILEAILFYVSWLTFHSYYFIPDFILSKVYANTLLATLNARSGWGSAMAAAHSSGARLASNDNTALGQTTGARTSLSSSRMKVHVDVHELSDQRSLGSDESDETLSKDEHSFRSSLPRIIEEQP